MYDVGRVTHMNPVLAWLLALSLLTACGQPGTPVSPPPPGTRPSVSLLQCAGRRRGPRYARIVFRHPPSSADGG